MLKSDFENKFSFIRNINESLLAEVPSDIVNQCEQLKEVSQCVKLILGSTNTTNKVNEFVENEIRDNKLCYFAKSKEKALSIKIEGNEAFKKGCNEKALSLYSQGISWMPFEEVQELSIIYANRSAALYHLREYEYAQLDIDTAINLNYPKELKYKLFERSGRCYAEVGKKTEASRRFQQALNSIQNLDMEASKLEKIRSSLQMALKSVTASGFSFSCNGKTGDHRAETKVLPNLSGCPSRIFRNASDKITVERNDSRGRYVIAKDEILAGETIIVEKAYVSTMTPEVYHSQCFQCFNLIKASVPCRNCAQISFCSTICRDTAWKTHHKYECEILGVLNVASVSITCLMALRILTQREFVEVIKWYDLIKPSDHNNSKVNHPPIINEVYKPDEIATIFQLVSHSHLRTFEDIFQRIIMSVFLVSMLQKSGYIPVIGQSIIDSDMAKSGKPENQDAVVKLVTILVKLLQLLQFNAHEIAGWDDALTKSRFIGGGLFPTLALFNHSCHPSIVRYFINDTVIVRTVRTIHRGEEVTENYGPVFTSWKTQDRILHLEKRYWFTCNCIACKEDWPLFENLSKDVLSFCCSTCHSFLCKTTTESFGLLFRCQKCLKPTNILKSLKTLEKSEGKYKLAIEFLDKGKLAIAEGILLENLRLFDSILLPPFKDYYRCQEALRKCYLPLGNKSKS